MNWNWLVERQICDAIEAGEFDDLPGVGRPLQLKENPHADPAWRLAFHLLDNSGYAPIWVEMMREVRRELEIARDDYRQACTHWADGDVERARAERRFELRIADINKRITDINLSVPLPALQWSKIDPACEMQKILASSSLDAEE